MTETKRRSLQFSLRTMLVIITCVAVWFGWHNSRSRVQRIAVEQLETSGVKVLYDYQLDGNGASDERELPYPAWLVKLLGIDFFATALAIQGHGLSATELDDSLGALRQLPSVKYVHFGGSKLGDVGLEHISQLESLERLGLEYTHVTAAGVAALRNAPQLKRLFLKGLPLEDEVLTDLATIQSLELLELNGAKVSEEGVQKLSASLPNCQVDWDASYR